MRILILRQFSEKMFEVCDLVFVVSPTVLGDVLEEFNFVIEGKAQVQNGWKCVLRTRNQPLVYDPKKQKKLALRLAVQKAVNGLDPALDFPLFRVTRLKMSVTFNLVNSLGRDLDNMIKFLQDALEGVIFDNDKFVVQLHAEKHEALYGNETTFVKVAKI